MSPSSALPSSSDLRSRFPRVAITHEWLTIPGGSEKVVIEILKLFPDAEIFTTIYDPDPWPEAITGRPVHTTFLNRIPGARRNYPKLLPLMDTAWRRFDLRGFDLVISSNHACAKNVRVPEGALHVCYCYTPMRYAWDPDFLAGERLGFAQRLAFRLITPRLRRTDLRGARGVDRFMAISRAVAQRIADNYGRESAIVHPPVDVGRFRGVAGAGAADAPYLLFGRLVPYKKADAAIEACAQLGRPLVVAGEGRDLERLQRLARGAHGIEFIGRVADADLPGLFARSRALLFPGLEDFGIVPVEAQAAGLPVIAYGVGGACDTVIDGKTGVLYGDQSAAGLAAAIERFESLTIVDSDLRSNADNFTPQRFAQQFAEVLVDV